MTAPIAPTALSGTPAFRGWLAADGDVGNYANGYATQWRAMTGSVASSNITSSDGKGFVSDPLGGPCMAGQFTSDGASSGGNQVILGSAQPSSNAFTLVIACNATANPENTTGFEAGSSTTIRPTVFGLSSTAFDTGSTLAKVALCLNHLRQWCIRTTGATMGTHDYTSTGRASASTQILVVTSGAGGLTIAVYANGVSTTIYSGAALAAKTLNLVGLGLDPFGTPGTTGWRGGIRGAVLVNSVLSGAQSAGLAQWMRDQVGDGMGDGTETKAVIFIGDSRFAGAYAPGVRSVAGRAAEALAGRAVVATVGISSATADWWSTSHRVLDMCSLGEMFPGHTITNYTFVLDLGTNDAGITGASETAVADYATALASVVSDLESLDSTVKVIVCTPVPAANAGGWGVAGANASKASFGAGGTAGLLGYRTEIMATYPLVLDLASNDAWACPDFESGWTDKQLANVTSSPPFNIAPTASTTAAGPNIWDQTHYGDRGTALVVEQLLAFAPFRSRIYGAWANRPLGTAITTRPF